MALWEDTKPMTYYMIWMRIFTNQSQIQHIQIIPSKKKKKKRDQRRNKHVMIQYYSLRLL